MARVLLVDDEPNVLMTIEAFLNEAGHEVRCAQNPIEAGALLQKEIFDVAVTDNIPPEKGVDIITTINNLQPDTKVVLISGQSTSALAKRAKKVGAFGWLQKPMDRNDICQMVNKAQNERFVSIQKRFLEKETKRNSIQNHDSIQQLFTGQLAQTQKLESIGALASGVAHEINNPLNGIMNYAELICIETPEDNRVHDLARRIIVESKRVASLVGNMLDFSRQKEEQARPVRIIDVIESVLPMTKSLMKKAQITLDLDIPESLPMIFCKPQQIQQVLINLITNACDSLDNKFPNFDKNKILQIRARLVGNKKKEVVCILVKDHGAGIPENLTSKIFEPFFTTKSNGKGTGLGLSICKEIISQHEGTLQVESQKSKFTQFNISLPPYFGEKEQ